jgi:hypothetical protein
MAKAAPRLTEADLLATRGAGTELYKLLSEVKGGLTAENCRCLEYARRMNARGIDWCERNVYLISTLLEDSAQRNDLPFDRELALEVINLAITNARQPSP